jgi:phospholipid/cholesterol/gamma-HCH transport system substrate-binding protein
MRRSWAAVTVGALALVVVAVSFALFRYTSEGLGAGDGYVVHAYFRDALGIVGKSPVRTAGLDIGKIEEKTLAPDARARISIRIQEGITLYENAQIAKKSASLLGEYYLDLDPGTAFEIRNGQRVEHRKLQHGDEIKDVREQTSVGEIMDQVGTIMPLIRDILRDVRELTSGQVKEIAERVNELVERNSIVLERLLLRIDNIAADVEGITRTQSDDIKIAITNIREITEGVKALVGTSSGEVSATGKEVRSSLQKLQSSVDKLDKSLGNVETITTRLKQGEGTAGRLLTDEGIANNIEQITEDAGGFVRGITRLQTIVGLRTEYNYLAGTFKNYFQVQLMPRPDKFYLIEIVDDPRGYREQTTEVRDNSERGVITERTIRTTDKLRFSLMFGKRGVLGLPWLTGRFGIKESTGGVGLDFSFLQDRLTLSADLFDARSNENPRLQGRATVSVYKQNLFVVAGADDLLNYQPAVGTGGAFFDWFFGLKLVFRDEDLKTLLLFGGSAVGAASQ